MCPVPPCTMALLPALLQLWLQVGFQDLLPQMALFVPAKLLNRILAAWAADAQHTNLHRRIDALRHGAGSTSLPVPLPRGSANPPPALQVFLAREEPSSSLGHERTDSKSY